MATKKDFTSLNKEEKLELGRSLLLQHPDRLPVIIKSPIKLRICKFLCPKEIPIYKLIIEIRERNILAQNESLHVFAKNTLLLPTMMLGLVHEKYKSDDGFLYLNFAKENSFG